MLTTERLVMLVLEEMPLMLRAVERELQILALRVKWRELMELACRRVAARKETVMALAVILWVAMVSPMPRWGERTLLR